MGVGLVPVAAHAVAAVHEGLEGEDGIGVLGAQGDADIRQAGAERGLVVFLDGGVGRTGDAGDVRGGFVRQEILRHVDEVVAAAQEVYLHDGDAAAKVAVTLGPVFFTGGVFVGGTEHLDNGDDVAVGIADLDPAVGLLIHDAVDGLGGDEVALGLVVLRLPLRGDALFPGFQDGDIGAVAFAGRLFLGGEEDGFLGAGFEAGGELVRDGVADVADEGRMDIRPESLQKRIHAGEWIVLRHEFNLRAIFWQATGEPPRLIVPLDQLWRALRRWMRGGWL